jgi:hypothetical protein
VGKNRLCCVRTWRVANPFGAPKGLMRMLGPTGNPHAKNLFAMVAFLQRHERVRFKVQSSSAAAQRLGKAGWHKQRCYPPAFGLEWRGWATCHYNQPNPSVLVTAAKRLEAKAGGD